MWIPGRATFLRAGGRDGIYPSDPWCLGVVVSSLWLLTLGLRAADCNLNGLEDAAEVAEGKGPDCNQNGIPDACDLAPRFALRAPESFAVGIFPTTVVSGDLNGDGMRDLVTVNEHTDDISVLINAGGGRFLPWVRYYAGGEINFKSSAVLADFDGDDDLDLALGVVVNSNVRVLMNRGDGTFVHAGGYRAGFTPWALVAEDLDQDGDLDLAVANKGAGTVSVLLNEGKGTFAPWVEYSAGCCTPNAMTAADFDGDGAVDVALSQESSCSVAVLRNVGGGALGPARSFTPPHIGDGICRREIAAGDFDRDGDEDLALAGFPGVLLWNDGKGDFLLDGEPTVLEGDRSGILATGDLDGDGDPDPVTASQEGLAPSIWVYRNGADRRFEETQAIFAGLDVTSATLSDLDSDGDLDLAVTAISLATVSVFWNRGDGTFPVPQHTPAGVSPYSVAAGDFDEDGDWDIAAAAVEEDSLHVFTNDSRGAFEISAVFTPGRGSKALTAADLDGDERLDLACAVGEGNRIALLWNEGAGSFAPLIHLPVGGMFDNELKAIAAADLNGDSRLDLAVRVGVPSSLTVLFGEGERRFRAPEAVVREEFRATFFSLPLGDVDGDGDLDFVAPPDVAPAAVTFFLNRGDGSFEKGQALPYQGSVFELALADLDGDGDLDMALPEDLGLRECVLTPVFNNGKGEFERGERMKLTHPQIGLTTADIDGDGDIDLVAAGRCQCAQVFFNAGDGRFPDVRAFAAGDPTRFAFGDFDGDQDLDIVTGGRGGVTLLWNEPGHSLSLDRNSNQVPDECEGRFFHRGDADGDGRLNLTDAVYLVGHLFQGGEAPPCREASDSDNDAQVSLTDAIVVLRYLFQQGEPPRSPGPPPEPCGPDPEAPGSPADLGCERYEACRAGGA